MGIVELNVPEQWSRDLVVEFLQFIKKQKTKENKNREIITLIPLYRSKAFFSEILQMLNRHLLFSQDLRAGLGNKEILIITRQTGTQRR